jgi:hypothetical protein
MWNQGDQPGARRHLERVFDEITSLSIIGHI